LSLLTTIKKSDSATNKTLANVNHQRQSSALSVVAESILIVAPFSSKLSRYRPHKPAELRKVSWPFHDVIVRLFGFDCPDGGVRAQNVGYTIVHYRCAKG